MVVIASTTFESPLSYYLRWLHIRIGILGGGTLGSSGVRFLSGLMCENIADLSFMDRLYVNAGSFYKTPFYS